MEKYQEPVASAARAFTPLHPHGVLFSLHSNKPYHWLNLLHAFALWNSFLKTLQKNPFSLATLTWSLGEVPQVCHSDLFLILRSRIQFFFSYVMTLRCHKNQVNFTTFTIATAVALSHSPLSSQCLSSLFALHFTSLPVTIDYSCFHPLLWIIYATILTGKGIIKSKIYI